MYPYVQADEASRFDLRNWHRSTIESHGHMTSGLA